MTPEEWREKWLAEPCPNILTPGAKFSVTCKCSVCTERRTAHLQSTGAKGAASSRAKAEAARLRRIDEFGEDPREKLPPEPDEVMVARLVKGIGIPGDALPCEKREAAQELLLKRSDLSRAEIADRVGLNVRSIERYAQRLGVKSQDNRKRPPGETRRLLGELIKANPRMSASRAGEMLGISTGCANQHHKKLVEEGILPARTKEDIDNPRWRGYHDNVFDYKAGGQCV